MNKGETNNNFNSLLEEKNIFNERLREVYDLILDDNFDEALYELEEVNKRYPNIADVYHLKFKVYCIKGNYYLAEKVIMEAEKLFSENEKIQEDRDYLRKVKISKRNEYLDLEQYHNLTQDKEKEIKDKKNVDVSSRYYRALNVVNLRKK